MLATPRLRHDPRATDPRWHHSVRRKDGSWLTRPAEMAGRPEGNMETWTRRIPDGWRFDTAADAREAARAHGLDPDGFDVVTAPRKAGDWLKLEGDFAPAAPAAS